jgi:short-subunit dehydrogenase
MKALITGASSGIGKEMAFELATLGYDLILVARREDKLLEVKSKLNVNVDIIALDLSILENVYKLFEVVKHENIDIMINNAGFGYLGEFYKMDNNKIQNMINLNVTAVTVLTKLFIEYFENINGGYLLNVASSAAFTNGPLMSEYYASKSYVYRLTLGVQEELRQRKSKVKVSVLCPGPVETEFDKNANVQNSKKGLSARYVARYAIKKMLKGKSIIIPGVKAKLGKFFARFLSERTLSKIGYRFQSKKDR